MTSPQLPGLPGRGRTYAFLAGVAATTLTLAVAVPFALGERPDRAGGEQTVAFGDPSAAPLGPGLVAPDGTVLPPGASVAPDGSVVAQDGTVLAPPGSVPPGSAAGSGTAPGSAAGPGPAVAAPPPAAPAPAAGGPRRASDQGITADAVRVGWFIIDFGEANGLGAGATGYDPEVQKRDVQAFVDEINATGGINGRRLVPVFRNVDILDQQTMRDACTTFGQTDRVFAVGQNFGVYGDAILKCAIDQKLPFLAQDGAASSYYAQSRNYVITTQPSTLRTLLNMERELVRRGELKDKKVGVLYYDGYLLADNQVLLRQLRKDGVDVVEGQISVNDVGLALRQIPTVAQNFCQQGVETVLLLTNSLYGRQFVQNVERFPGCRPAYAVSDFDFTFVGDGFVRGMPNSFFQRALGVTASRHGEGRVGLAEPAHDARCRATYEKRTGRTLDRNAQANSDYTNALTVCQVVQLVRDGLAAAGTNPTRQGFVDALQRRGAFPNAGFGASSFRPGRTDATDVVRISQAFLDCKCWKPQTPFVTAAVR